MSYGWVIVAVSFLTQFLITGFVFYSFGVVLKDLVAEFGGGRTGVSAIYLVMPWTGALIAPFVGRWAGQGRLRALIALGTVATGVGCLLASRATRLWHLYLVFPTFMSFGGNTMTGICASAIVVNWFERRRAMALGISQIGASAGGMVMGPATAALVASLGWRGTYALYGAITLAVAPLVWWLAVAQPEERGLAPERRLGPERGREPRGPGPEPGAGAGAEPAPLPRNPGRGSRLAPRAAEAVREPNLWLIAFVTGVGFMIASTLLTHMVAFATDAGLDSVRASALLSLLAAGALAGKPLFGGLADRLGERAAFSVCLLLQALGLLGVIHAPGTGTLFAVMLLLGLGIGGVLPLSSALLARAFGPESFGPMMGLMMPLLTPLVSAGVPFAAFVFDRTGSYTPALWTFLGALGAAALALGRVRLPRAEELHVPAPGGAASG